jgi:mannose-6-phosphate isomerase-like protein (cupin superfamily)
MSRCSQILEKFLKDSSLYLDLIKSAFEARLCLELTDTGDSATLVFGKECKVLEGSVKPDVKVLMTSRVLECIARGEMDAFALAARGRADEKRPIEFEIIRNERSKEIWETLKALLTCFFTPGRIKIRNLKPELAGQAHGAHPIPIVYWNGLRCSWIFIKRGETLNKNGEKNPYPQVFIIIEGKGKAVIADMQFEIKPSMAIYVPTNSIHQIIAEDDIKLLWLAWNAS